MNNLYNQEIHYRLLKMVESTPNLTQRKMTEKMGISLGKVNYCISELAQQGFIRIERFKDSKNKKKYIYSLTPKGIEEKARLTINFLKRKITEYEEIKKQIKKLASEINDHKFIDDHKIDFIIED